MITFSRAIIAGLITLALFWILCTIAAKTRDDIISLDNKVIEKHQETINYYGLEDYF